MKILYTASATTKGGRHGHGETSDGSVKVDLSIPKEMGGSGEKGPNPEQLFAIGYSACFGGALEFVAQQKKTQLKDVEVTAKVGIGPREEGGFGLAVDLSVRLPGISKAEGEALIDDAHKICPYSNATRGNVEVKTTLLD